MDQKENEKMKENKTDKSSDASCPICEGQGCECSQNDIKNDSKNETNDEAQNETEDRSSEDLLTQEIESLKEEKIRLLAEMENLRKRFDREKVETIKFGSINLARDILSPADNLERALTALPDNEELSKNIKNLVEGLKMVLKEFKNILESHGVKKIVSIDQKFDHNFHQAMMEVERDDVEAGIVVQEVQSGYTMHDRLLRPSMVGVSKKANIKDASVDDENEDNKSTEVKNK